MSYIRRNKWFLLAGTLLILLGAGGFIFFRFFKDFQRMTDWSAMLQKQMGPGFTVGEVFTQDSLLVLDSLRVGSVLKVARITVKKDFYSKIGHPGMAPVVFLFKDAEVFGFSFAGGMFTLSIPHPDSADVLLTGIQSSREEFKSLTAQGVFTGLKTAAFLSRNFHVEAQGLSARFDSLVLMRDGTFRGIAGGDAETGALQSVLGLNDAIRGSIEWNGFFRTGPGGLESRGVLKADTLDVRGSRVYGLSATYVKSGSHYVFPTFNARLFGGMGSGHAEFFDNPDRKSCSVFLFLKGADLNLLPKRPEGLAFQGRYNGKMDFSGRGKTWPELMRKLQIR